jgi:hypothetical protein
LRAPATSSKKNPSKINVCWGFVLPEQFLLNNINHLASQVQIRLLNPATICGREKERRHGDHIAQMHTNGLLSGKALREYEIIHSLFEDRSLSRVAGALPQTGIRFLDQVSELMSGVSNGLLRRRGGTISYYA